LELPGASVAVQHRALEDVPLVSGRSCAIGEQAQDTTLLAGGEQLVEARPDEFVGPVPEDAQTGRALVLARRGRADHADQIARVGHECGEARLAAPLVYLFGQVRALERERQLRRQ